MSEAKISPQHQEQVGMADWALPTSSLFSPFLLCLPVLKSTCKILDNPASLRQARQPL